MPAQQNRHLRMAEQSRSGAGPAEKQSPGGERGGLPGQETISRTGCSAAALRAAVQANTGK